MKFDENSDKTMLKILILCTGNTCRSQMAQGFLQSFDPRLLVSSAGTNPGESINEMAVRVMKEAGIDISRNKPKPVALFINDPWDYVITVCDEANETCPVFIGKVKHRLHIGFGDPSKATGSEVYIMNEFRKVRDEIKEEFQKLYNNNLKQDPDGRKNQGN
jgi:arsenate reductase